MNRNCRQLLAWIWLSITNKCISISQDSIVIMNGNKNWSLNIHQKAGLEKINLRTILTKSGQWLNLGKCHAVWFNISVSLRFFLQMVGDRHSMEHLRIHRGFERLRQSAIGSQQIGFQVGNYRGHPLPDMIYSLLIADRQVDDKLFRQVHYTSAKPG